MIRKFVGTEKYTADKIGESDSEVRIYDNFVLKIQPQSPETDNEYHIVKWLSLKQPNIMSPMVLWILKTPSRRPSGMAALKIRKNFLND